MGQSQIGVQFVGKPWDHLRSVPVDRAGESIFSLRPRLEQYVDRLACEVTVEDNVKVVTLRSTYKIENSTLYPVELLLIDENNHPVGSVQKIGVWPVTTWRLLN
jgi:vacuolar protein sorting-associated protein 13A/C